MTKTRTLGLLVAVVVSMSGCYLDWGSWHDDSTYSTSPPPVYDYSSAGSLSISNGWVDGQVGSVTVADDAWRAEGNDFGGYSTIEVEARSATGDAMAVVDVSGGLNNAALMPGTVMTFSATEPTRGPVQVNVIGCSGPVTGNWVYDQMADQVSVRIDAGATPATRILTFEAVFVDEYGSGDTTTAQGSFEYEVF